MTKLGLLIHMQELEKLSLERIRTFLEGSPEVQFDGQGRQEVYAWVDQTLSQQDYSRQGRAERGLLRRWVAKMTGLSRAQAARLIARYRKGEPVTPAVYRRHRFPRRYGPADVALLVQLI